MTHSIKQYTLAFVLEGSKILLGMKKRGFGMGRWNGFGGKVDREDHSIKAAATRELFEECNLMATTLDDVGVIKFEFVGEPVIMEVHIFKTSMYTGYVKESEEMRPQWFEIDAIPFKEMWPDDYLWIPMMISGEKLEGYFKFEGHDKILDYTLKKL